MGITSKKIIDSQSALPSSRLLTRGQRAALYMQQCQQALKSVRESMADKKWLTFNRSLSPYLVSPMFQSL